MMLISMAYPYICLRFRTYKCKEDESITHKD